MIFRVILLISASAIILGQLTLPHGHELHTLIDQSFGPLDNNPKDGVLKEAEWDSSINKFYTGDNDTCIDRQEYYNLYKNLSLTVAETMFNHFDHDSDGCIAVNDMSTEFHLMDHSGDGTVTLHEYEQYFSHLLNTLFGHGHNG